MTYATFLIVFLLPPILMLGVWRPRTLDGVSTARRRYSLPLILVIAFVYTTPWDNYLVYRGVWWYGSDRVLGTIGYVPIEEYAFFLLQPLLSGLILYHVLDRYPLASRSWRPVARWIGSIPYAAATLLGIGLLLGPEKGLYLGLILAWAGPILLGTWLYAGPFLAQASRQLLVAVAIPSVYLWVVDRIAIGQGIWDISNRYSLDLDPLGLPLEEAVFFLATNVLVVQGLLLFLYGGQIADARRRFRASRMARPGPSLHTSNLR